MRRTLCALLVGAAALRCATSEEEKDRKVPGGFADAGPDGGGTGGTGGSGGSPADATTEAEVEAATDAGTDAAADAEMDASDADVADASDAALEAEADAAPNEALLLVGRSTNSVVFAEKSGTAWSSTTQSFAATSVPALTLTGSGAIAVVRAQNNELDFATWNGSSWTTLSPVGVAGVTIGSPALARQNDALLVFLGTDNKIYENRYSAAGSWQGFLPVTVGSVQSFGPSAPSVAALGNSAFAIAQEGNDGDLYTQSWNTTWQAAHAHGLLVKLRPGTSPSVTPRGANVVVAYVETGSDKIIWTEGAGSSWSSPTAVPNATTVDPVALTTLDSGDVMLAYRGKDARVRASILSGTSFATPVLVSATDSAVGSPSVAPGVAGHTAEATFVSGGAILHSFLQSGVWSTPIVVATGGLEAMSLVKKNLP
jgi:hypothetical protein